TRLLAAATAAAATLWSPQPLEPAEPLSAAAAASILPVGGVAFVATYTGTSHGTVLLVVDREMADTLQDSSIGALSLVDAARGVLEAAASSTGPVALGTVTQTDAVEVLAEQPGLVVFPMTSAGTVHAAVALTVSDRAEARGG